MIIVVVVAIAKQKADNEDLRRYLLSDPLRLVKNQPIFNHTVNHL